ncbi:MAG TPA: hypothetical protein VK502_03465 [Candidatus Saccharimonadales bacterium]|nr:hypothetical protein [Candidatus Saccharimonadales bacterium]
MKRFEPLESKLIGARRATEGNDIFVTQVMDAIKVRAINSRVIRTTNEQLNKETFIMKLRKLPIALLVAIVLATVIGIGGISYAAVKVIEAAKPTVKESRISPNGKTQITVEKNTCSELEQARSERYELKEGVELSKEDAANYINAHCHLLLVNERLDLRGAILTSGIASGTVTSTRDNTISLKIRDALYGPLDASVSFYDKDVQQINPTDFKVGDEVLAYRDIRNISANQPIIAVFKPIEALKYYDPSQQQNIRTVKPCENNETMDCVTPSSYSAVTLVAGRGGASIPQPRSTKEIQGTLVEHTNDHFILENNGHKIIFQTPYDVVARYNQTTVYGLAQYDSIYAHTDPEKLKIAVGDSLSTYYTAEANETTISWNKFSVIALMVEREPSDPNVLRKY